MIGYAPCGECRAYVPENAGCEHWTPRAVKVRLKADAQRLIDMPRDPVDGRTPVARVVALRRAAKQRAILNDCIAAPDATVWLNGDRAVQSACLKMAQQGYVEKVGARHGRAAGIGYRITPLGRIVLLEYDRAYPPGQMLPLPLRQGGL